MRIVRMMLCVATAAGVISADPIFAAVQDGRVDVSADGATIKFDVKDVSRREVMERLFAGTGIELKWINTAFADEQIGGTFSGTQAAVIRALLSQADFIIGYDENARLSRVIIVGPARKDGAGASPAALALVAAAIEQNGVRVMQPADATPVAAEAEQRAPAPATPVAAGAEQRAPAPATPVAAEAELRAPAPATPVGMGAELRAPAPATPVAGMGAARR